MKRVVHDLIRSVCLLLLVCACYPGVAAYAQGAKLELSSFSKLETKASESVDITLDGKMLQLAAKFLSKEKGQDAAKVKDLITGLQGIYVKNFNFEKSGQYETAEIDALREKLRTSGWTRMVGVLNKDEGGKTEVYVMNEGGNMAGLAIISAEATELTIINIVGTIDLERLSDLQGNFGIPELNFNPKHRNTKSKAQNQ